MIRARIKTDYFDCDSKKNTDEKAKVCENTANKHFEQNHFKKDAVENIDEKTIFYDEQRNDETNAAKKSKVLTKIKEIKKVKHIELIIAFCIALLAIMIYFSFSIVPTNKQIKQKEKEYNKDLSGSVARLLSTIDGVGECEVLITFSETDEIFNDSNDGDKIVGVVIVAEGGGDTKVKIKIVDAVMALLNVNGRDIKVYKMK